MNRSLWFTALVALALAVAACQPVLPVEQEQPTASSDMEVFSQGCCDTGPNGY